MKKTITLILCFVLLGGLAVVSIGQNLPVEKHSIDTILMSKKISIKIANHGSAHVSYLGNSILTIKQKKNGKKLIDYHDLLETNNLHIIINEAQFNELIDALYGLVEVHEPDKELKGCCVIIDKNYELSGNGMIMTIKPRKISAEFFKFDQWIYKIKEK